MKTFFIQLIILYSMATTAFSQKETLILVHGQWHGAWCWNKLIPELNSRKVNVVAIDLPGLGADTTNIESVTLEHDVNAVVKVAKAQAGRVILLGHSSSGVAIAQASALLGDSKVSSLIFLDAFLPKSGESVFSLADKYAPGGTTLSRSLVISANHKVVSLNPDGLSDVLYNQCSNADIVYAQSHLRPGSVAVLATPAQLNSVYDNIPKYYVLCTKANDMNKTEMLKNVPCKRVITIESDHSPFFSMPDKLAGVIADIVNEK